MTNARDTRSRIVASATRLFAERGYENTTIRDIARMARIGKSTVFYYFKGKEEILESIIEEAIGSVLRELQSIASAKLPPEEKFLRALNNHIHYLTKYINNVKVFLYEFKFLSDRKKREYINIRKHYESIFRKVVEELQKAGVFRGLDSKVVTMGILGMCNWMVIWYRRKSGNLGPREIATVFYRMLLKGSAQRSESNHLYKSLKEEGVQ